MYDRFALGVAYARAVVADDGDTAAAILSVQREPGEVARTLVTVLDALWTLAGEAMPSGVGLAPLDSVLADLHGAMIECSATETAGQ